MTTTKTWRDAILSNANGIAMEAPMIVLHGKDADALLAASCAMVERMCTEGAWGPKEQDDVSLPRSEWGSGRRVVVDRRYHTLTGALLVKVPDPTISNASISSDDPEKEGEVLHAGAAHVARCAGVLEVVKEFASAWCVDMRRRIIIIHLACRLPKPYQGALRKIIEDFHASTLMVLTATRPFSLDHGLHSRGVFVPVPCAPLKPTGGFDPLGLVTKALESSTLNGDQVYSVIESCVGIDHTVSRIRALGGDIVAARNAGVKALNETAKKLRPPKKSKKSTL